MPQPSHESGFSLAPANASAAVDRSATTHGGRRLARRVLARWTKLSALSVVTALTAFAATSAPALAADCTLPSGPTTTATFTYTGSDQSFAVPAGVSCVQVTAVGAMGAQGGNGNAPGYGANVESSFDLASIGYATGEGLTVDVGQNGGPYGGGGTGGTGTGTNTGGSGGGATSLILNTAPLLIAAGGGGSSGGGSFGDPTYGAGGNAGQMGEAFCNSSVALGGAPGTTSGPGAGGTGCAVAGSPGLGETGGAGADGPPAATASAGGGGGGGGYFGGGGGGSYKGADPSYVGAGGGGGGSSYSADANATFTIDTTGVPTLTITYVLVCAPGSYSSTGYAPCTPAPAGSFVADQQATEATPCDLGSYQPNTGSISCVPATAGAYVSATGQSAETPCGAGTYSTAIGAQSPDTCTPAPAGSFVANQQATEATPCDLGSYQPNTGSITCIVAAAGYYVSSTGQNAETPCAAGTYSSATHASSPTTCQAAAAGNYVAAPGSSAELPCPKGTYQPNSGAITCIGASSGYYVGTTGQYEQTPCAVGTYSVAINPTLGIQSCIAAPAGSYVDTPAASSPQQCDPGTYEPVTGAIACLPADSGYYVNVSGQQGETPCTAGTDSVKTPGASVGPLTCNPAPDGTYIATSAASSPTPCASGTYSPQPGATSQADCLTTPITQTIIWAPQGPYTYGEPAQALTATAPDGAVTYSVLSGPCSIGGSSSAPTLVLGGAGPCVVQAAQAGDNIYAPATTSSVITVNPAPLTALVTGSETYGGAPGFNYLLEGVVNNDDPSAVVSGTLTGCQTSAAADVSTYANTISGCSGLAPNGNYTVRYSDGGFTVFPASLTITPTATSMPYGGSYTTDSVPTITPSYVGLEHGDGGPAIAPTCSTTATTSSAAGGSYTSSCMGAADPNYTISYATASFTVVPRTVGVHVYGSGVYGASPSTYVFTVGAADFDNGDPDTGPGTSLSCTIMLPYDTVGLYLNPLNCSGYGNANYIPEFLTISFFITPAPVTITASPQSFVYGTTPPMITASYSGLQYGQGVPLTPPSCSTTASPTSTVGSTQTSSCSGASDPDYTFSYVSSPVTVTAAPATVTASSPSMVYGATPPTITPGYGGLVNGAQAPASAPSCSTTATSKSAVGSTQASSCANASDPNYSFTYIPGTVTVTPAPLTVTVTGSQIYGSGTQSFTVAGVDGLQNGDPASVVSGTLSCQSTATSSSAVKAYTGTISHCSGLSAGNYTITYLDGGYTVNPAPLSITASSPSMVYGASVPTITPSYSGLQNGAGAPATAPICSTTATVTSAVGSTPTSSCAGAADPNYAITYTSGTVTITPAPLTITASSASMVYGATSPVITASYSGLLNGAKAPAGAPSCSTTATATSAAGSTQTSSCKGATDPNYTITYKSGTVTVTPAPLTITASSASMVYGATLPTITPGYSGLQNGATAAATAPTCTTTAKSTSPVGSYATNCSGAADGNYTITYKAGTFSVTAAPLLITAASPSITYGSAVPAITASYATLVNADTPTALGTALKCTTTATTTSAPGSYPTSCTGAVDTNYTITYKAGSLTITQTTPTLSYTGPQTASTKSTFVPAATLTVAPSGCLSGQVIAFTLNVNPITGAAGPYTLESATTNSSGVATGASISTSSWVYGSYAVTATYAGTTSCVGSATTMALQVTEPGLATNGYGVYTVPGAGTVSAAFDAVAVPGKTTSYVGEISLVNNNRWAFYATVTTYAKSSSTAASLTGKGSLYYWSATLNHNIGGWVLAGSNIAYTATYTATTKTSLGTFGVNLAYTPAAGQPSPLPNSAAIALTKGAIVIS